MNLSLPLVALLALLVSERLLLDGSRFVPWLRSAAFLLVGLSLVLQGLTLRGQADERRARWQALALTALVALGMIVLVALLPLQTGLPKLPVLAASLLAMALGALGLAFALWTRAQAPFDHAMCADRVRAAVSLALLVLSLAALNAWVLEHDVRADLSYRRASEPSAAVRELAGRLRQPIEVTLLFAPYSEVELALRPYFESLARQAHGLRLRTLDANAAPELARATQVRGNGHVILSSGSGPGRRQEVLRVGRELSSARRVLRALDGHVAHHLGALLLPERRVYVSHGHGEPSLGGSHDQERTRRLTDLTALLARFHVQLAPLGLREGLGRDLPADAAAVLVLGPSRPFLEAEVASLRNYLERGGKLLLGLDPGSDLGLEPLLTRLGIAKSEASLVCTEHHLVRTRRPVDRELVYARARPRPPSLPLHGAHAREFGAVFMRAATIAQVASKGRAKVEVVLSSDDDCFCDEDGDHERDAGEPAGELGLVALVDLFGARAVVVGDSDFFTDELLRNETNSLITLDLMRFLLGEPALSAVAISEEDVPIEHTRAGERR